MHAIFDVSMLKKCVGDPTSIVSLEGLEVDESLSYEKVLVEILDWQVKKLKNNDIASVNVLWRNQLVDSAIWKDVIDMMSRYRHLCPSSPILA